MTQLSRFLTGFKCRKSENAGLALHLSRGREHVGLYDSASDMARTRQERELHKIIRLMCSMKGDVKRKHFPADGGSWISLASRPCAMESRRSGRRLELDIHAVPLMPTEPGRMQAAGLGLPTMVLSETRGLWLCGVVRGWPRVSPRPAREFARGV